MVTCFSILAWRILWTEESGGLQSMGHKELDMTNRDSHFHFTHTHYTSGLQGKGKSVGFQVEEDGEFQTFFPELLTA